MSQFCKVEILLKKNEFGKIIIPINLSKGQTTLAPLVGSCACGNPILAVENIEGTFQLPTALFGNGKNAFTCRR